MEMLLALAIIFESCVVLNLWFIEFYTSGHVTWPFYKFVWAAAQAKKHDLEREGRMKTSRQHWTKYYCSKK